MTVDCGHLLVVDDERLNRMVLERALTERGYTVETAENGEQALALLRRRQPDFDVVLLDVLMPALDGYRDTRTHQGGRCAGARPGDHGVRAG